MFYSDAIRIKGFVLIEYVKFYLKGACMGVADVIPGVSGGTLALMLNTSQLPNGTSTHVHAHNILSKKGVALSPLPITDPVTP